MVRGLVNEGWPPDRYEIEASPLPAPVSAGRSPPSKSDARRDRGTPFRRHTLDSLGKERIQAPWLPTLFQTGCKGVRSRLETSGRHGAPCAGVRSFTGVTQRPGVQRSNSGRAALNRPNACTSWLPRSEESTKQSPPIPVSAVRKSPTNTGPLHRGVHSRCHRVSEFDKRIFRRKGRDVAQTGRYCGPKQGERSGKAEIAHLN